MCKRLVVLAAIVLFAVVPSVAYEWNHAASAPRGGNLVEQRAAILETAENCFSSMECYHNYGAGTLLDFFESFQSELLAKDSNTVLFSYDELFLLYALSVQFYDDKSVAWAGLVGLLENAGAVRDSLSRRNNPFAQDTAFASSLAQMVNYKEVEDNFALLDVPRELKDAFRVLLEGIIVKHSWARLVDIEAESHGGSQAGYSYEFIEKARDRFLAKYPQSRYAGLIREYIPEGYAKKNVAERNNAKKWLMFSMGLGAGKPFYGGELGETVDVAFAISAIGEFQIGRFVFAFAGFDGGLGSKKTLFKGTDDEMKGSGFGFLMAQLNASLGFAVIEMNRFTFDLLAGIELDNYSLVDDTDYEIQGFGPQFGAQLDFKIPLSGFKDLFFRVRYTFALESAELYIPDAVAEKRPEVRDFPEFGPADGLRHSVSLIVGLCAGFPKSLLTEGSW